MTRAITTNDAFRAVCKYWDRINRPEQLMSAMINAMRVLTDPADTGAVAVCLPQDTEGEAYDYPDYFFQKRVHRIERTSATKEMVKEAADTIKQAKKTDHYMRRRCPVFGSSGYVEGVCRGF